MSLRALAWGARAIGKGTLGGQGVAGQIGRGFQKGGGWGGMGRASLTWAGRGGIAGGAMGGAMGAVGAMGDEDRTMARGAFGGIARGAMIGAGAGAVGGAAWNVAGGGQALTRARTGTAGAGQTGRTRNALNNIKQSRRDFADAARGSIDNAILSNNTLGNMAQTDANRLISIFDAQRKNVINILHGT